MPQAEACHSSGAAGTVAGNSDDLTGVTVILDQEALDDFNSPTFAALVRCDRLGTLLQLITDITEEAIAVEGFWARTPDYHRRRIELVNRTIYMARDELRSIDRLLGVAA